MEKEKLLFSLRALLKSSGSWLGTSYPKNMEILNWFDPGRMVYKIDSSVSSGIIQGNLVSGDLARELTYFNQRVASFNQLIDIFLAYLYSNDRLHQIGIEFYKKELESCSDYGKCILKIENSKLNQDEIFYIKKIYSLKKAIHTGGIGDDSNYDDGYPKLRKCFMNLEVIYTKETNNKFRLFSSKKYLLGDIFFLITPGILIVSSLIKWYYFFKPCIKCFLGKII